MRVVLLGAGSFIARHVARACADAGLDTLALPHDGKPESVLAQDDVLANFAISPLYRGAAYDPAADFDLKAAIAAAQAGARFMMASTRKVYGPGEQWPGREDTASGDGSFYGENKLASEGKVTDLLGERALILRLSNVFGFEYAEGTPRGSFFGFLLSRLKTEGKIRFDMHPDSRRDFIPVESCAKAMVDAIVNGLHGTYNLGAGFPVSCGQVARWVIEGYGAGSLDVTNTAILDEFYLDMRKWQARIPAALDLSNLQTCCINIGRKLRNV